MTRPQLRDSAALVLVELCACIDIAESRRFVVEDDRDHREVRIPGVYLAPAAREKIAQVRMQAALA